MEIWYLDSGSLHGIPSVMNYEQTIKQIIETTPSWEKDGGGIRGRTIAPIISGTSLSGGIAEFVPQQFNQQKNETFQRAREPIADLALDGGGSSGGGATIHPFKIYRRVEDEVTEVKVESASSVYSGFGSFTTTEITGLDFWTAAAVGYVIVVAEVSAGGSVTSQEVLWGQGSLGSRITFSEEIQTGYRFPIAYLYLDENDSLRIRQLSFTDKTLVTLCVNGKSATYPIST